MGITAAMLSGDNMTAGLGLWAVLGAGDLTGGLQDQGDRCSGFEQTASKGVII